MVVAQRILFCCCSMDSEAAVAQRILKLNSSLSFGTLAWLKNGRGAKNLIAEYVVQLV